MDGGESSRNHGTQPLDVLLDELGLTNRDLVAASTEQLTHKQVQKARKGRRVTENIQRKILNALNAVSDHRHGLEDLFDYRS